MKKSTLVLAGLLIAGTASLNAGFSNGSTVTATGNKVDAKVDHSTVEDSTVGMQIKAKGSTVIANDNKANAKVTGHSTVKKSNVGLNIEAER